MTRSEAWARGLAIVEPYQITAPAEMLAGKEYPEEVLHLITCASCGRPPSARVWIRELGGQGYWCHECWHTNCNCALCDAPALKLPVYLGLCRDHYLEA